VGAVHAAGGRTQGLSVVQIPPRQVPFAIARAHPELQLLTSDQAGVVHGLVEGSDGFGALVGSVQQQGQPAADSGWARLEEIVLSDGKPAKKSTGATIYRLRLTDETLAAAVPVLTQVLGQAMADESLRDYCWTVQRGVVPGPESGGGAAPSWSVKSLGPRFGLELPGVAFDGGSGALTVMCVNDVPQHRAVYGEFRAAGQPIAPSGWKSRLPAGVPAALETGTLKYLGLLGPNAPVAGLSMPAGPATMPVPLPAAADAVALSFGGFGSGGWAALPDAAAVMLTFVLDYALPAVMQAANAPVDDGWYQKLVADPAVQAEVMAAAAPLVKEASIRDTASLLGYLAAALPAAMLDKGLAKLRGKVDTHLGTDSVANAAPVLGWAAQTAGAVFAAAPPAYSQLASMPGTFGLTLSRGFAPTVEASVEPDESRGDWPDAAVSGAVECTYAGGFTQAASGKLPAEPPAAPVAPSFPSVRADAPVEVRATLFAAPGGAASAAAGGAASAAAAAASPQGPVVASGSVLIPSPHADSGGRLPAAVHVTDRPVSVSPSTRWSLRRTLAYDSASNTYSWGPGQASSATRQSLACEPGKGQLCALAAITLQQGTRSLGYAWRTTDAGVGQCGGGGPLTVSYRLQSVGTVDPGSGLRTIDCGFAARAQLAYAPSPAAAAVFLDPRVQPAALRAVTLGGSGPIDLSSTKSLGRLADPEVTALALHPAGLAIAAGPAGMQIADLAAQPVADADAPLSRLVSGTGEREGLLGSPVAVAVAPGGELLVLDAQYARVQAFDVRGNPVPMFGGSPFMALQAESGIDYQDLAVSPSGLVYVLSNAAGGQQASDYRLDVYAADGAFLARTTGVNAARIAVDSAERVYTLDYRAIAGLGGRTEPSISQWAPAG
jgi:hypothetical protein